MILTWLIDTTKVIVSPSPVRCLRCPTSCCEALALDGLAKHQLFTKWLNLLFSVIFGKQTIRFSHLCLRWKDSMVSSHSTGWRLFKWNTNMETALSEYFLYSLHLPGLSFLLPFYYSRVCLRHISAFICGRVILEWSSSQFIFSIIRWWVIQLLSSFKMENWQQMLQLWRESRLRNASAYFDRQRSIHWKIPRAVVLFPVLAAPNI